MNFLISNKKENSFDRCIQVKDNYINFTMNHKVKEREYLFEDSNIIVLSDANLGFINKLINIKHTDEVQKIINDLKNGFVIFVEKENGKINIYNDIFGFYHLFYIKNKDNIFVSNNFNDLLRYSEKKIDVFAVLDLYLFNYTLLNRTTLFDIKRIQGGRVLNLKKQKIQSSFNYFDYKIGKEKINYKTFSNLLKDSIKGELEEKSKITLTMTAGFDSRTLLALCSNLHLDFDTFTFGQKGNIEIETIKPFIDKFSKNHRLIVLGGEFLSNFENYYNKFLLSNLDNPVILDTPHYSYVNDLIEPSNLIVGFMGGEILEGQSIGAQVTFTDIAGELLLSNEIPILSEKILTRIKTDKILSNLFDKSTINKYVSSLAKYFYREDKLNIIDFLINEKYSKFFGAVNKVFINKQNIIVPIMDANVLNNIFNSNISFLNKEPFKHNPFENLKSKMLHAKAIKYLCPRLKDTKFDRLYCVNDLCNPLRLPLAGLGYFKSHILKTNKVNFPRPHSYDEWYKKLVTSKDWENNIYINTKFIFNENTYNHLDSRTKKMIANLMGFFDSHKKILEIVND